VQVEDDPGDPDVPACTLCGDCMTGCNVGAKKSLDTTLLRDAYRKGAEIYTGGSVLKIRRLAADAPGHHGARWSVTTVFTDESLRRRHAKLELHARHVILAAGTLGSTEILLRSRSYALPVSKKLGQQFSCNGDNLAAVHGGPKEVRTTTEEHSPLRGRAIGPTITSVVELDHMLVEEFAVPAPLKRLFDETVTTSRLLHDLGKPPGLSGVAANGCDSFGVDADAMKNTLLLGLIGHDESAGQVLLDDPKRMDDSRHLEGRVRVHWPQARSSFLLERGFEQAKQLARQARGEEVAFLPSPAWRLLPQDMEFLVNHQRGPVMTVHPLGGCPMGASHLEGVVDDCGRVFDAGAARAGHPAVHEGLVVLDGAIIPASLGANPSLMIAAVAKRAAGKLAAEWGLVAGGGAERPLRRRPVLRKPEHCTPKPPQPTEVDLVERLVGRAGSRLVELTLRYRPAPVAQLVSGQRPKLRVDPARSFVRVYDGDADTRRLLITWSEATRDERALAVARLRGELDFLRQEPGLDRLPRKPVLAI
jgi:choline dehydrogenase-like flavoprotein